MLHFKRIVILLVLKIKENFLQLLTTNKTPCTICQKKIPQWRKKKAVTSIKQIAKSLGELREPKLLSNTQVWHQLKLRTMKWNKKLRKSSQNTDVNDEFNATTDQQCGLKTENLKVRRTWVCYGAEVTIEEYLGLQFSRLFHWDGTARFRF